MNQNSLKKGGKQISVKQQKQDLIQIDGNNNKYISQKQEEADFYQLLRQVELFQYEIGEYTVTSERNPNQNENIQQANQLMQEFQSKLGEDLKILTENKCYIQKFLEQGGEGKIYEGYFINDEGQEQEVIFKILYNSKKKEIQSEVDIMNQFDKNINVIKLIRWIEINDLTHVLILEKCKYSLQTELQQITQNNTEFTEMKLIKMIFDLLDGLIQFRVYNTLHLDIKPGNILVTQEDIYVYSDFGISSRYVKNKETKIKGYTTKYASEEQIQDYKDTDFQSDVYSLGRTFQDIVNVYKQINVDRFNKKRIDQFEDFINQNMIQKQKSVRKSCHELHRQIIDYFITTLTIQFFKEYDLKIDLILNTLYYDKNKDIPYFKEIVLYYLGIKIRFNSKLKRSEVQTIQLMLFLSQIYFDFGNFQLSLEFQLKVLEGYKQVCKNKQDLQITECHYHIWLCYCNLGNYEKGSKHLQICQDMILESDGHSQLAKQIMFKLIITYLDLEFFDQAFQVWVDFLQFTNSNIVLCEKDYIEFLLTLQRTLPLIQDREHIQKCQKQCLENYNKFKFKSEKHPYNTIYLNTIGLLYLKLGDVQKGKQYCLDSHKMTELLYNENSEEISDSLYILNKVYMQLGDYDIAKEYNIESLQMRDKIKMWINLKTVKYLINLGELCQIIDDQNGALQYLNHSIQIREKISSTHSIQTIKILRDLSKVYFKLENYENAVKFGVEHLKITEQLLTGNHSETANSLENLSLYLIKVGDYQYSLKSSLLSLKIRKQLFSGSNVYIANSYQQIGMVYASFGDYKTALQYYKQSLEMRRDLELNDSETAQVLHDLSYSMSKLHDFKNALHYSLESLKLRKQLYSGNHPDIAISLDNTGVWYLRLGYYKKALQFCQESFEMRKQIYKGIHFDIAQSYQHLSLIYMYLDDFQISLKYCLESLKIRKQLFNGNHLEVYRSLYLRAEIHRRFDKFENWFIYTIESIQMEQNLLKQNNQSYYFKRVFNTIKMLIFQFALWFWKSGKRVNYFLLFIIGFYSYKKIKHFSNKLNSTNSQIIEFIIFFMWKFIS